MRNTAVAEANWLMLSSMLLFAELPDLCLSSAGAHPPKQPGFIQIHTSEYLLARPFLRVLLHISPQFQREMSTEWR